MSEIHPPTPADANTGGNQPAPAEAAAVIATQTAQAAAIAEAPKKLDNAIKTLALVDEKKEKEAAPRLGKVRPGPVH